MKITFMQSIWLCISLIFFNLSFVYAQAQNQQNTVEKLPKHLREWATWTIRQNPEWSCPIDLSTERSNDVDLSFRCLWPSAIEINVLKQKAHFKIEISNLSLATDDFLTLPLPYFQNTPPQNTSIKNLNTSEIKALAIIHEGIPPFSVKIPAGNFLIEGDFEWENEPEYLEFPNETFGNIVLKRNDQLIPWHKYDEENRLWLQKEEEDQQSVDPQSENQSFVTIFRRIDDGIPIKVTTKIKLNVAGQKRELILKNISALSNQNDQQKLLSLSSALPTEFKGNDLKVYLKSGQYEIDFAMHLLESVKQIQVPSLEIEMNQPEVWTWFNSIHRTTSLSGLLPVSADQTQLPSDWIGTEIFLAQPTQKLNIIERQRGIKDVYPDSLTLNRSIWMDLDGNGLSIRDKITGSMNQASRLNYLDKGVVGRVSNQSQNENLLITADPKTSLEGVEIRSNQISIEADLRLENHQNQFSVTGWDKTFNQVSIDLNLPPGWLFINATGPNEAHGAWINQWHLINLFFVVLIVLISKHLLGIRWAVATLLIFLFYHDLSKLPQWTWLQLLVTIALLRYIKHQMTYRLIWIYRWLIFLIFIVEILNLAGQDLRVAIYPQLENRPFNSSAYASATDLRDSSEDVSYQKNAEYDDRRHYSASPARKKINFSIDEEQENQNNMIQSKKKMTYQKKEFYQEPQLMIQTGLGVPNWTWNQYRLSFSSTVSSTDEIKLWLLPPWIFSPIKALIVFLMLIMSVILFHRPIALSFNPLPDDQNQVPKTPNQASISLLVLLLSFCLILLPNLLLAQEQQIQSNFNESINQIAQIPQAIPNDDTLEWIEEQIKPEGCIGACITFAKAKLFVEKDRIELNGILQAEQIATFSMIGPISQVRWDEIRLFAVSPLKYEKTNILIPSKQALSQNHQLISVPMGVYWIEAKGRLAPFTQINLQVTTLPVQTQFESKDWEAQGITDQKWEGTLSLSPISHAKVDQNNDPNKANEILNPDKNPDKNPEIKDQGALQQMQETWFSVTRKLEISHRWEVTTIIKRNQSHLAQNFNLPLLTGEQLLNADVTVNQGQALLQFPAGVEEIEINGELSQTAQLKMSVQPQNLWNEKWFIRCSMIWQCSFKSSLLPIAVQQFEYEYWPWPKEDLSIEFNRPKGIEGPVSTIENVEHEYSPGQSIAKSVLKFDIRASRTVSRAVTLPEGALNVTLKIDKQPKFISLEQGKVNFQALTGKHSVEITWDLKQSRHFKEELPKLSFDGEIVNLTLTIKKGENRFLLWTSGPDWGPAVLFWGELFVLLLLSLAIGRYRALPINRLEIFLLSLGLMQLSSLLWVIMIGWFFAFHIRRDFIPKWQFDSFAFNTAQVLLVGLTILCAAILYSAIHYNLISEVNLQVAGRDSTCYQLNWYVDRVNGTLPTASIFSLPMIAWRMLMLVWSFWLVSKLLGWSKWALEGLLMEKGWIHQDEQIIRSKSEASKQVTDISLKADVKSDLKSDSKITPDPKPKVENQPLWKKVLKVIFWLFIGFVVLIIIVGVLGSIFL